MQCLYYTADCVKSCPFFGAQTDSTPELLSDCSADYFYVKCLLQIRGYLHFGKRRLVLR